jgi:hypothetical protein
MNTPRIMAFTYCYNEQDILPWTLRHMLEQGLDVTVMDNWSTDNSWEAVLELAKKNPERIHPSRYPVAGPLSQVSWYDMLKLVETKALQASLDGYDWVMHYDADEIRRSPVPGETLVDFLLDVDALGFTAVNHEVIAYKQKETYWGGEDPETYFTDEVEQHVDHFNGQVKCWKQPKDCIVDLASSGGHRVRFPGLNICPERLLLKHYPLRSNEQAKRKLKERRERWTESDRARGWHVQYDPVKTRLKLHKVT